MATSEGAAVLQMGQSPARKTLGKAGTYLSLSLLSLLVLGPIALTVIQALSPPFTYVDQGRPLHPVAVSWQDRTWFTGGIASLVFRTVIVLLLFAWLQKVASGGSWRSLLAPARLVAIIGGTVVLAVAMGPVFQSFHKGDGGTAVVVAVAMAVVAATQVWGYSSGGRSIGVALVMAAFTAFGIVALCILFVGPTVWTLAWTRFDLGPAMWRSFIMTICVTVLQVATAIMAAYAFVFLRFPFKRILFALFMATLLLPIEVTLVGNVATIRQLGWTDTMQALVLPFGAAALGTFLIRQGFRGLPSEIQDATRLDGYGHVAFLTKFAVPLTRPVIAAFTVISALAAWNQYLWPRSVIETNSFNTLQIQLRLASASEVANANQAIAAALVAAVPVILLLIAFQRQIIRGLTAGAVK
ncbi:carbohydrate ABC transporter permease [Aquihabitans sp. McL0605]|uniref:carbohydrate ABC transporter permease n=1 Tax=Aquihabitans sp. McL0605 TaxID=3415671 RepID=UPI003CF9CC44